MNRQTALRWGAPRNRQRKKVYGADAAYHVVTRTAFRRFIFQDREKEVFVRMMRRQADFAGITVMAYCVMSNHVHMLVKVPEVPADEVEDKEILRRYRVLYPTDGTPTMPHPDVMERVFKQGDEDRDYWRERLLARMHSLEAFVGELKQRFSIFYNKTHENRGTIWSERFRSTIVELDPTVLTVVAAYIDLNPVRAQLVDDPADYRFCGFAAGVAGVELAQRGYCEMYRHQRTWSEFRDDYCLLIYGKGSRSKGGGSGKDAGVVPVDRLNEVKELGGRLPVHELVRRKLRYVSDGAVIGSREFVEDMSERVGSSSAKSGGRPAAHRWQGSEEPLFSLRGLKKEVVS